jgi:hypothetical protein
MDRPLKAKPVISQKENDMANNDVSNGHNGEEVHLNLTKFSVPLRKLAVSEKCFLYGLGLLTVSLVAIAIATPLGNPIGVWFAVLSLASAVGGGILWALAAGWAIENAIFRQTQNRMKR